MLINTMVGPIAVWNRHHVIVFNGRLYTTDRVMTVDTYRNEPLTPAEFTAIPWLQVQADSCVDCPDYLLIFRFPHPVGVNLGPDKAKITTIYFIPADPTQATSRWCKYIQVRIEQFRLAICMSVHPRLGASSPLNALDKDILALICKLL